MSSRASRGGAPGLRASKQSDHCHLQDPGGKSQEDVEVSTPSLGRGSRAGGGGREEPCPAGFCPTQRSCKTSADQVLPLSRGPEGDFALYKA